MRSLSIAGLLAVDFRRVQCVVAQDGVVEEAELLFHGPVAGDDEAGDDEAGDDEAGDDEAGDPVAISTSAPTSTAAPTSTPRPRPRQPPDLLPLPVPGLL